MGRVPVDSHCVCDTFLEMRTRQVTTLLLVYTLFEIPLEIAFLDEGCPWTEIAVFNLFVDVMFCIDIAVAFHTGFVVKVGGEKILEDNHYLIAQRYLGGWFVVDLVSSIPVERMVCHGMASGNGEEMQLEVLRVFKVARFAAPPAVQIVGLGDGTNASIGTSTTTSVSISTSTSTSSNTSTSSRPGSL